MTVSATFLRRVAHALLARAARVMPGGRAAWIAAMTEEMHHIADDSDALRWALGCLAASYSERVNSMGLQERINRVGAVVPIAMSVLALATVVAVVATGWERHLKDEGAAAHIFQLLIAGQVPFIVGFLATANWRRVMQVVRPMAVQVTALALALGSVAFFRL